MSTDTPLDRVFVHALNTVKKLPRTGLSRPAPEDRLKLYGLYKQSMEGDVDRIMSKPEGTSDEVVTEAKKWQVDQRMRYGHDRRANLDALSGTHGIHRRAMHRYATTSPDAVELVAELEFVWDQIKSNVPSSSSSSPLETTNNPPIYPTLSSGDNLLSPAHDFDQGGDEEEEYEEYDTTDEFDEHGLPRMLVLRAGAEDDEVFDESSPIETGKRASRISSYNKPTTDVGVADPPANPAKWRRRVEQALTKMTAEVAALREQLELRRSTTAAARTRLALLRRWVVYVAWVTMKHVIIDAVLVALVLAWMKRRGDKRAELVLKLLSGFVGERIPWRRGKRIMAKVSERQSVGTSNEAVV